MYMYILVNTDYSIAPLWRCRINSDSLIIPLGFNSSPGDKISNCGSPLTSSINIYTIYIFISIYIFIYIYIYITINFGTRLKLLLRVSRLMRSSGNLKLSDDRIKRETLSNNLSLVPKFIVIASSI